MSVASGSAPIGRVDEVGDVSALASDESGLTTRAEHIIDGGLTAL